MSTLQRVSNLETLQIRLLHLLPADGVDARDEACLTSSWSDMKQTNLVRCLTTECLLNASPPYVALSYTWGDAKDKDPIIIDGKVAQVTKNLAAALRQLRDPNGIRTLWIDAVCINQKDDDERTEQVQHMREIFSRAISLIAWLGPASPDGASNTGMQWIRDFGGRAHALGIGTSPRRQLRPLLTELNSENGQVNSETKNFLEDLTYSLTGVDNVERGYLVSGLQDILLRRYWSRIWVVQEVAVAATVQFVCGGESVGEEELHHATRLLRNFRFWQKLSGSNTALIQTDPTLPMRMLRIRRRSERYVMIRLIWRLMQFEATDGRDQVFAILGIASDASSLGLRVDYSKSSAQVFTELARILLRQGYFNVLSFCTSSPSLQLPSWVPDLSRGPDCHLLQHWVGAQLQPGYMASGRSQQPQADLSRELDGTLHLYGCKIGILELVGKSWMNEGIGEWLQTIQTLLCSTDSRVILPAERRRALWRCGTLDQEIRQHLSKPRLTDATIDKLEAAFKGADIGMLDSEAFHAVGLGSYSTEVDRIAGGRRPALDNGGHVVIAPHNALPSDIVVTFFGANVPYVLRPVSAEHDYRVVGEAYVDGAMDGQCILDTRSELFILR